MRHLLILLTCLILAAPALAIDIGAQPACAGYDEDTGSCPTHIAATACPVLTADGVIAPDAGRLVSLIIQSTTATEDILIYDNPTTNSGTVILNLSNIPVGTYPIASYPAPFSTGAYLDVAGTGLTVNVCYSN